MKILCDMDGVLCDFVGGALDKFGMDIKNWTPGEWDDFGHQDVASLAADREFWANLHPTPWLVRLLSLLGKHDPGWTVCTIPMQDDACKSGKWDWIRKHLGFVCYFPVRVIMCADKSRYATPNTILIDDNEDNVKRFQEAGGHAILFPALWNRLYTKSADPIPYIEGWLRDITDCECDPLPRERPVSPTGGEKETNGAKFGLLPWDVLWEDAELYGRGAKKYQARNWEKGYSFSSSFDALQRHAAKFWNGEDIDPETGCKHTTCIRFHAAALGRFLDKFPQYDDRPKT